MWEVVFLNNDIESSIYVLRNKNLQAADDRFMWNQGPKKQRDILFVRHLISDMNNKFYLGPNASTMMSNLTSLWLFEHQGYHFNDALSMSLYRSEKGWESYLNNIYQFARFPKVDTDYDPFRRRTRFFEFKDLYGIKVHRVHTYDDPKRRDKAIISFIFSDGYNEFMSKQMITTKWETNKYYLTGQDCEFSIDHTDFTHIYPQFKL